jgi:phosphatidate cytidylyltransferase
VKKILIRATTGAVFVSLIMGSILWDRSFFAGLFLVFGVVGFWEFYRLFENRDIKPQKFPGIITGALTYFVLELISQNFIGPVWLFMIFPLILVIFIIELYRKKEFPFQNIAITVIPIFYIAIPLAMLNFMFSPWRLTGENDPNLLLGFFIIIWVGDTMAYLGGVGLGKHHLFERISPKKTWEGSIAGAIFSLATAWFLSIFFKELNTYQWLGMAAIIVVAGTFGDLVESMLKRSAQVKDSGTLLPGHGGVLDRFDGVFISAPFVLLYLRLINSIL